jgi:hypothetical protein
MTRSTVDPFSIQAPTSDLIAYYPFTNNTNDVSGNQLHGILSGNPTYETQPTPALYMIGNADPYSASGGHVLIPMIDFNNIKSFSITLWVKDDALLNPHGEAYIWYGEHVSGAIGITNFYDSLMFWVGTRTISIPYNPEDRGNYLKLSLVYNNKVMSAYKNEVLIGRKRNVMFNITHTTAAIARHWWVEANGTYGTSTRFKGSIREVRIYNRALTKKEIKKFI